MSDLRRDADTLVVPLANGVRVIVVPMPQLETASVSVFVKSGSGHESRRLNGISHFVEHMAFKGTQERSCQQINLDAERLGAEVNAHTDKDHTAYHMRGMAGDALRFITMLGDIVRNSTFPAEEIERERQVILHEVMEDEEDSLASADKMFDKTWFGEHPLARPIIGSRLVIGRIARADLLGYVQQQYSGANVIVGVAGNVDADAVVRTAEAAFGSMPAGVPNAMAPVAYGGGVAVKAESGTSQSHVVFGYPAPGLHEPGQHAAVVAAALFGEGMSSPLLDEIRERRGLVYHADCTAEIGELGGQFVIEASTGPEQLDEFFTEVTRLLREHADRVDAVALERAKNQIAVRRARAHERPVRRLEDAALDVFAFGHVRSRAARVEPVRALSAADVRDAFATMLAQPASVAVAGRLKKGAAERIRTLFAQGLR